MNHCESNKIAHLIVKYTRGKVLDIGCGVRKAFPHFIGVDVIKTDATDLVMESSDLSLVSDKSIDAVFSSYLLQDYDDTTKAKMLKEWTNKLKVGGYLVLYLPNTIKKGEIRKLLIENTICGWSQLENEERINPTVEENAIFEVYQKRHDGNVYENVWQRNPDGKKRALVIRFGAIGDQLQASSILEGLKKQDFHITWLGHPTSKKILQNNPLIDEWHVQDENQVPNLELGAFVESLKERYDRVINLCESVEGLLLSMPGRITHSYPKEARDYLYGNVNYLELTAKIAGVETGKVKHYASELEKAIAKNEREKHAAPIIVWALTGSSFHKTYPYTDIVIKWLLENTPAHIYLYGDDIAGKPLQDAILQSLKDNGVDISRVHGICGQWDISASLAFALEANIVVGPETGILNAVCHEKMGKVIYLSHSSQNNLTKCWVNTTVLIPDDCPCSPCHILHYTWDFCHKVEKTAASLCTTNIKPERVFKAIMDHLVKLIKE